LLGRNDMLVTNIIGNCPKCGTEASFGNVFVKGHILTRGCLRCDYSEHFYLPQTEKTVLYLDQFFLSHAFREKVPEFVECIRLISNLADDQLMVCPISSVHETETHQWRHAQKDELWEFIKRTSRGHEFKPAYEIKRRQIIQGFKMYLVQAQSEFPVTHSDALPHDINEWEDYFWIDVGHYPSNVELTRRLKEDSISELVDAFPKWLQSAKSFQDHRAFELRTAGDIYISLYRRMIQRIAVGDCSAIFDSPIDSKIVEAMLHCFENERDLKEQLETVRSYFQSPYFSQVPCEYISTGLITVLRDRVKRGSFKNPEKAKKQLRGFFFDVDFIAAYAPYCDAMFLDTTMLSFVRDKRLAIEKRYGTKFYAKSNWGEFMDFLKSINARKTEELTRAIELVYPNKLGNAKT